MPSLLADAAHHGDWATVLLVSAAVVHFLVCATALTVVDLREHRLPNRWTAALAVGGLATLGAAGLLDGGTDRLIGMLAGGVGYLVLMVTLHLASRGGLGLGDVKLAGGLGLYTGWLGWEPLAQSVLLAFIIGGLMALALVLLRRATGSTRVPFGPPMLLSAAAVVLFSG